MLDSDVIQFKSHLMSCFWLCMIFDHMTYMLTKSPPGFAESELSKVCIVLASGVCAWKMRVLISGQIGHTCTLDHDPTRPSERTSDNIPASEPLRSSTERHVGCEVRQRRIDLLWLTNHSPFGHQHGINERKRT